jgi:hypothetical protein
MTTLVEEAVSAFMAYLRRHNAAPKTPVKYGQHLATFAAWAGERQLGDIAAAQIEMGYLAGWYEDFEQRRGKAPSPSTHKNHVQALRAL